MHQLHQPQFYMVEVGSIMQIKILLAIAEDQKSCLKFCKYRTITYMAFIVLRVPWTPFHNSSELGKALADTGARGVFWHLAGIHFRGGFVDAKMNLIPFTLHFRAKADDSIQSISQSKITSLLWKISQLHWQRNQWEFNWSPLGAELKNRKYSRSFTKLDYQVWPKHWVFDKVKKWVNGIRPQVLLWKIQVIIPQDLGSQMLLRSPGFQCINGIFWEFLQNSLSQLALPINLPFLQESITSKHIQSLKGPVDSSAYTPFKSLGIKRIWLYCYMKHSFQHFKIESGRNETMVFASLFFSGVPKSFPSATQKSWSPAPPEAQSVPTRE